jgi:hypothetical protein
MESSTGDTGLAMSEEKGDEALPQQYRLIVPRWLSSGPYRVTKVDGQLVWHVGSSARFSPDLVIRDSSGAATPP